MGLVTENVASFSFSATCSEQDAKIMMVAI
jgi:hypothetical protein